VVFDIDDELLSGNRYERYARDVPEAARRQGACGGRPLTTLALRLVKLVRERLSGIAV